ncbi:hypothetical protein PHLCEN_2v3370 [Hermanssonia centrifuga]|uniref:Uncharacterized protein n=1 Tax=Hermanssonia centrifuga TaxID=98765 RepID=A0A2R6QM27_9APHY|nr:hypothetical protein PHLCEN_2v3370 [Hermanssonia centrifuga]
MSNPRVWVITGTSSGLGLALALHVLSHGDKVIATVRSLSRFPDSLKDLDAKPLVVDFSHSDEQVISAAHEALQIYGYVDVLVNNAANGVIGPVEELKLSDIRSQFQTNLFGIIAFTQPFVAHFRTRRTGHILNVSSIGSSVTAPGWAAYCGSKAALDSFTHALHQELKLFGVRVLSIMPGYFSTAFFANHRRDNSSEPAIDTSSRQSKIYTDPVTQGYDTTNALPRGAAERGLIGDPEKFGQRIYEVVTGTGMAEGLVARPGVDGKWEGEWQWNIVPLGTDCVNLLKSRLEHINENVATFEAISKSTEVEQEQLKYYPLGERSG